MSVGEGKAGDGPLAMGKGMNAVDNILWHGEGSPVVATMSIPSGSEGTGPSGA